MKNILKNIARDIFTIIKAIWKSKTIDIALWSAIFYFMMKYLSAFDAIAITLGFFAALLTNISSYIYDIKSFFDDVNEEKEKLDIMSKHEIDEESHY